MLNRAIGRRKVSSDVLGLSVRSCIDDEQKEHLMLKTTTQTLCQTMMAASAAFLLATVVAGCSSAAPEGDASTDDKGTGSSDVAQVGACLRDAGFDVNDDELVAGVLAPPEGADVAEYEEALRNCAEGTSLAPEDAPDGDEMAAVQAQLLEYVACLRDLGYTDIPDPVDGELDLPPEYTSTDSSNTFPEDAEECQYAFDTSSSGSDEGQS